MPNVVINGTERVGDSHGINVNLDLTHRDGVILGMPS